MARIEVEVEDTMVTDGGRTLPGILVTCTECQEQVECFGRSKRGVRRACMILKEECSNSDGGGNYYHDPDIDDRDD